MRFDDDWSGNISLSLEIINSFDHDGDGVASNQTGEATFNFVAGVYTFEIFREKKNPITKICDGVVCICTVTRGGRGVHEPPDRLVPPPTHTEGDPTGRWRDL